MSARELGGSGESGPRDGTAAGDESGLGGELQA